MGRRTLATDPMGNQTAYGFDADGNPTGVTQIPAGSGTPHATTMAYNTLNEETATTDPAGDQTTYAYDASGNRTSVTDPLGHQTTSAFDAANRLTKVTDPLGDQTTYGYNAAGEQTCVTDPLSRQTTYAYRNRGWQTSVTDPRGAQTIYGYDLAGNQTSVTDPDGNQTTYAYNADNLLTKMTDPLGNSATYAYDADNELTSTTDRDGRTTTYAFDAAKRLTGETWVGGSYTATFNYNQDGQVTMAQDPFSTYTYAYNNDGLVTGVYNAGTPGVPTVTLSYGYDGYLNQTSLTDTLGGSISYGFDAVDRLTSMSLSLTSTLDAQVTFGYDAASRLTGLTDTAGTGSATITDSLAYDNADRLTSLTYKNGGTTLAGFTYVYDQASQITSYSDAAGNSLSYGYDQSGELLTASGTLAGQSYSASYSYNSSGDKYDLNGNRLTSTVDLNGSPTTAIYSTSHNELKSDGTYSYTYDNEGNLTTQVTIATGSVTYYSYDYRNRLTEVKVETSLGTVINDEKFTYDVNNNRIGISLNGTQQSWTVYDGKNPYIDFNGSGTLTERYMMEPKGQNQFYARVNAVGTVNWYVTDNLGSIREIASSSGAVLDTLTYDPFGGIISETNTANGDRFKFTGGAYDSITGNYQFGQRFYGPSDGRWNSQDPLGLKPDANPYRYVDNSPTDESDPTGFFGRWRGRGGCPCPYGPPLPPPPPGMFGPPLPPPGMFGPPLQPMPRIPTVSSSGFSGGHEPLPGFGEEGHAGSTRPSEWMLVNPRFYDFHGNVLFWMQQYSFLHRSWGYTWIRVRGAVFTEMKDPSGKPTEGGITGAMPIETRFVPTPKNAPPVPPSPD